MLAQLTQLTKLSVDEEFVPVGLLHVAGLTRLELFCISFEDGEVSKYRNKVRPSANCQSMSRAVLQHFGQHTSQQLAVWHTTTACWQLLDSYNTAVFVTAALQRLRIMLMQQAPQVC